jgi:hypothetical protein
MGIVKRNISTNISQQPNLARELFWDWRYSEIDWQKSYRSIIERVLERGTKEEWEELIRFYSKPAIIAALKTDIKFLPDYTIEEVCKYFNLQKEELACYVRKQLRKGHWI